MIKASAKMHDGRHLVVLGLVEENLLRLRAGQPIFLDMQTLHIPATETIGTLVLYYGATEADCSRQLQGLITRDTAVVVEKRGPTEPQ